MLDAMDFLLFTWALSSIQQEFGLTSAIMGLLTSVALVAGAIGGVSFGALADRIGRVRAMTISILLYSLATAGLATSQSLWQLIAWRVLVGFGMGGEWSCGSVLVAETWPPERRGRAMGIMQSGWAIGAMIAAGLARMVLGPYGWRVLFLVGAFPALAAFFIRRGVEEPKVWRERKESVQLTEIFGATLVQRTVLATAVASSVLVAYWSLTSWLPTFLASPIGKGGAGLSLAKGTSWVMILQVGAFFGYITFGWIADRIGRRLSFTLFMIGATVCVPLFAFGARSAWTLLLIGPLVGYFGHGYFSVFGAMLAELFPTRIRATAQGFCYNFGRVVSAAAPYTIGTAAAKFGLAIPLAASAVFFGLGGALIWLLPETKGTSL